MTDLLEQAREQHAVGNDARAVACLGSLTQLYDLTESQAHGVLELASEICETTGKARVRSRSEKVIGQMRLLIARHRNDPWCVAPVRECTVLGGGGLPPRVDECWDLDFDHDELLLAKEGRDAVRVPYADIVALEIGGPGKTTEGGGFIGGGFGLEGAVEGMLIATALNLVTTRTSITTVICLKTPTAELHLLNSEETPEAMRMRLSSFDFVRWLMRHRPRLRHSRRAPRTWSTGCTSSRSCSTRDS